MEMLPERDALRTHERYDFSYIDKLLRGVLRTPVEGLRSRVEAIASRGRRADGCGGGGGVDAWPG